MPPTRTTRRHRIRAPQIERETSLVPIAAARQVLEEASAFLGVNLPGRFAVRIAFMAHRVYVHSPSFRRSLRRADERARDTFYAFLRHWLAARLHEERPDLYRRLPTDFSVGKELPPPMIKPAASHGFGAEW